MNIKRLIVTAFVILSFTATVFGENMKTKRPNVVIVISDDHRHDWMGHKNKLLQTPHLDRLGETG